MILRFILEIILLSFQIMVTVFSSVNSIICFSKVAEENKTNMIEGLNNLQTLGGNKMVFR